MKPIIDCNARKATNLVALWKILPSTLLPIAVAGYVVRPKVLTEFERREIPALNTHVTETARLRDYVESSALDEQAAEYESLSSVLRELIPTELTSFEVYHQMRRSALTVGVTLHSVQLGAERSLGWNLGSRQVRAAEIHLVGEGLPGAFIELIDNARQSGLPLGVRSLDMTAKNESSAEYSMTAILETYWSTREKTDETQLDDPTASQ